MNRPNYTVQIEAWKNHDYRKISNDLLSKIEVPNRTLYYPNSWYRERVITSFSSTDKIQCLFRFHCSAVVVLTFLERRIIRRWIHETTKASSPCPSYSPSTDQISVLQAHSLITPAFNSYIYMHLLSKVSENFLVSSFLSSTLWMESTNSESFRLHFDFLQSAFSRSCALAVSVPTKLAFLLYQPGLGLIIEGGHPYLEWKRSLLSTCVQVLTWNNCQAVTWCFIENLLSVSKHSHRIVDSPRCTLNPPVIQSWPAFYTCQSLEYIFYLVSIRLNLTKWYSCFARELYCSAAICRTLCISGIRWYRY